MKKLIMTLFCVIAVSVTACAAPPTAKMTLHIRDAETGEPLGKVAVKTQFRPDENKRLVPETKQTDTNGICIVEGAIDYICISSGLEKEGYYWQTAQLNFKKRNRILNRWEPWNPTVEVKMRPKKKPMPMIHYQQNSNWVKMPEKDKPIGFDLEKSDWVAPYGKGKITDFIFHPYRIDTDKEIRFGYKLLFNHPLDGIQEYVPPEDMCTSYISYNFPYLAPTNGYVSCMEKIKIDPVRGQVETNMNKQNDYIFRVRSYEDENGNIVGSYGRIKGEIMMSGQFGLQFEYWFNPVPNERSLEYSGENLLKQ